MIVVDNEICKWLQGNHLYKTHIGFSINEAQDNTRQQVLLSCCNSFFNDFSFSQISRGNYIYLSILLSIGV